MTGAELIAAERQRQIDKEGFSAGHDDEYNSGQLVNAAACYLSSGQATLFGGEAHPQILKLWPWSQGWWKPKDPISDLVRAGALIAAEIDRIQRIQERF
ncbi:MAG: hypothetical protein FDZ69_07535 [Deltaproteobacteria bacterium]|nr:MAG: hypothetical protein FDZ69_07535 [Deltaproteobacteria bacterium]